MNFGNDAIKNEVLGYVAKQKEYWHQIAQENLKNKDFASAGDLYNKLIACDNKDCTALLGKLLSELKVSSKEELANYSEPFINNASFIKLLNVADENLKKELLSQPFFDSLMLTR